MRASNMTPSAADCISRTVSKSIVNGAKLMPMYSGVDKNPLRDRASTSHHWDLPMDTTSPWTEVVVPSLILYCGRSTVRSARPAHKRVGDTIVIWTMDECRYMGTSPMWGMAIRSSMHTNETT